MHNGSGDGGRGGVGTAWVHVHIVEDGVALFVYFFSFADILNVC